MDLSTAFLSSMSVNADMLSSGQGLVKAEPAKTSGQKFESYYDSYRNNKQDTAPVERSRTEKVSNAKTGRRNDVVDNNQAQGDRRNVSSSKDKNVAESSVQKTEESQTVKEKPDTSKKGEVKTVDGSENAELEQNIMAEVASTLGISQEDLALIMQELNIQPVQLTQNEEVIKLVQEYLQIEEPAQMLTAPNFKDIVDNVGIAVNEAVQQTEELVLDEQNVLAQQKTVDVQSSNTNSKNESADEVNEEAVETLSKRVAVAVENPEDTEETNEASVNENIVTDTADSPETGNQQNAGNMFNSNSSNTGANTQAQQTTDSSLNNVSGTFANVSQQAAQAREISAPSRSEAAQRMETVIQQIADKMKVDIKFDSNEMNLVLKPESLGSISLKLISEKGGVIAQFVAESQRAKEIIEANMSQLKDSLQQQGINVNEISVEIGNDSQSEQMRRFLNEQAKSGRRIHQLLQREGFGEEEAENIEENTPASLDQSVGNSVNYKA